MRIIRIPLLLISALLLMLGHGAKIGFCPCHDTLFLYDCRCTGEVEHSCSSSCSHHHSADLADSGQEKPSSPSFPERDDHDCGNITAETSPYFYVSGGNSADLAHFQASFVILPEISLPLLLTCIWEQFILPYSTGPPLGIPPPYSGHTRPLLI